MSFSETFDYGISKTNLKISFYYYSRDRFERFVTYCSFNCKLVNFSDNYALRNYFLKLS